MRWEGRYQFTSRQSWKDKSGGIARELPCATLSVRLADITFMRTYNAKIGIRAAVFVTASDALLLILSHWFPVSWISVPWWSVNFASWPLIYPCMDMLRPGSWSMVGLVIGAWLMSAAFWSVAAGFVFRRRYAA